MKGLIIINVLTIMLGIFAWVLDYKRQEINKIRLIKYYFIFELLLLPFLIILFFLKINVPEPIAIIIIVILVLKYPLNYWI
jgi:hypothetical protein